MVANTLMTHRWATEAHAVLQYSRQWLTTRPRGWVPRLILCYFFGYYVCIGRRVLENTTVGWKWLTSLSNSKHYLCVTYIFWHSTSHYQTKRPLYSVSQCDFWHSFNTTAFQFTFSSSAFLPPLLLPFLLSISLLTAVRCGEKTYEAWILMDISNYYQLLKHKNDLLFTVMIVMSW